MAKKSYSTGKFMSYYHIYVLFLHCIFIQLQFSMFLILSASLMRINAFFFFFADQVGIPELYHFVYKSKSTAQYTSPELEAPYVEPEEQERCVSCVSW